MIPRYVSVKTVNLTEQNSAPPGMQQADLADRYEPGRPSVPEFLKLFQQAVAEEQRRKAQEARTVQQMLQIMQGGH